MCDMTCMYTEVCGVLNHTCDMTHSYVRDTVQIRRHCNRLQQTATDCNTYDQEIYVIYVRDTADTE